MRIVLTLASLLIATSTWSSTLPGQSAFDAGDFEKARAMISASPELATSANLKLMLAEIEMAENNLDSAETLIAAALEIEEDNAQAYTLRGQLMGTKASRASLFRAGKFAKKSLAALERALEIDPDDEAALIGMIQYRMSAPKLFGGDIDEAERLAKRLAGINEIAGNIQLAELYGAQGKTEQQTTLLKQLAQTHPNDPRAPVALGFLYQTEKDWSQAEKMFIQGAQSTQDGQLAIQSRQMARYQVGRTAVMSGTENNSKLIFAIKSLTDYLEGPQRADLPGVEWAHYRRGLLYERMDNRQSDAKRDFDIAARSEDPDLKRALRGS